MDDVQHVVGIKHDGNKVRMDLLPWRGLWAVGEVMTSGAKKYGERNWEQGIENWRLVAAALRHITKHVCGYATDPQTGHLHLAHAAASLLMAMHNMTVNRNINEEIE